MEAFRDVTLRRLVSTLKDSRVEERLGITLKDPSEFDFQYVLGIVNKLKDGKDAPKSKSCKNFIRSCYRKVEDNRGVIGGILEMIPDDIYVTVHIAVNLLEFERNKHEQEAERRKSHGETNRQTAAAWLKGLKGFPYDAKLDLTYLFEHLEILSNDEKNVSNSMMHSEQIGNWLKADESRILNVEPETPAESLINPISFASALMVTTLRLPARYSVLAFFCMHRNNDDRSDEKSGSIALIKSLNAQLLAFVAESRPQVDLSKLRDLEYFRKSKKSLKESLDLFSSMVAMLSEDDKVFIVIDSLSRLSGSATNEDKVIKRLGRIVNEEHGPTVKILITATLGSSRVRRIADESLFVRDMASGFGALNVDVMEGEILKSVDARPITRRDASEDSSDTDSE
ncbi:hypothetical protein E8E14_000500 [Neopestalotiopsis sp. 37M]|nr:hypothetical protein E8E14_000500 [Neopestalotiopsis sp. 37M]